MGILLSLLLFGYAAVALSAPLSQWTAEEDPELTAGYFEGDMVLDGERNGLRPDFTRWPDNVVYYRFHAQFDAPHINQILRAMSIIESVSCLQFKEAGENQTYFVNITSIAGGCYSNVGWANNTRTFNLVAHAIDRGCFRVGVIMHELLHTIGFYHMHTTWNRDDYVRIVAENITPGKEQFFRKQSKRSVDDFAEVYDYVSIMHYKATAFSVNGNMTIVPLQAAAIDVVGQRDGLSVSDIKKLNLMYRCPQAIE